MELVRRFGIPEGCQEETIIEDVEEQKETKTMTEIAKNIVETELTMLNDNEKEVAELMLDGKNKHGIMKALQIGEVKLNPMLCQIYKKTKDIVQYKTHKGKSQEFVSYFLGGSIEKSEDISTGLVDANNTEIKKGDILNLKDKVIVPNMPIVKTYCKDKQFTREELENAAIPESFTKLRPILEKSVDKSLAILENSVKKYEKEYTDLCFGIGQNCIDGECPTKERKEAALKARQKYSLSLEIIQEAKA